MPSRRMRGGGRGSPISGRGSNSTAGRGDPHADDLDDATMQTFGLEDQDLDQEHEREVPLSSASESRRGPNREILTPRDPSLRMRLTIEGGGFLDTNVVRDMAAIFRASFRGPWYRWRDVPPADKDLMFQRFQNKFQWAPELDDIARHAWNRVMQNRYSDWMRVARESAAARCYQNWQEEWDGEDFSRLRAHHPSWIPERFWHQMIDEMWDTERWRLRSRASKANRRTEFEGVSSRHTGGSISTAQHRHQMRRILGREPTTSEVYERTHCTNRKLVPGFPYPPTDPPRYIYPKAARAAERFRELRDAAHSNAQPDTPPLDDATLWEQSVGGRKKGRLFGFGTTQDPYYAMTGECSNNSSGRSFGPPAEVTELKEKIARMEVEAKEREDRYVVQLETEQKRRENLEAEQANQAAQLAAQVALSEHFASFMRQQGYTFPPPGPPAS